MKYAIVIPDGCADEPQEGLGDKTPLQAAHTPNMDHIARTGLVGRADNVEFHAGVSYRNILVYRGEGPSPFSTDTRTQPPHDVPDRPVAEHLPRGPGADLLVALMERSKAVLAGHLVNRARVEAGQRP